MTRSGYTTTGLLLALILAIAAVLVIELLNSPALQLKLTPMLSSKVPVDSDQAAPFKGLVIPSLSHYKEIVERPLFLATRRAPQILSAEEPKATEGNGELRLLGVVSTPQRTLVLLQTDATGKTARLERGQKVNGWLIEGISDRGVELRRGETVRSLELIPEKTTAHLEKTSKMERNQNVRREERPQRPPRGRVERGEHSRGTR